MYDVSNHNPASFPFVGQCGYDQNKPMFNNDSTGLHWDCCGFLNTVTNAGNNYFAGMFEGDKQYIASMDDGFPYFGCTWQHGARQNYGLFCSATNSFRNDNDHRMGFRACGYL